MKVRLRPSLKSESNCTLFQISTTLHFPCTLITLFLYVHLPLRFSGDQECYYEEDLRVLSGLTKKEHMRGNETLLDFRTSKFVLRISRDSYQLLKRHLQERQNNQIWNIIQEHLYIDIFDGMPRSKSQIDAMSGSLAGEAKREANKTKVGFLHHTFGCLTTWILNPWPYTEGIQ